MPKTAYQTKKIHLSEGLDIAYIEAGQGQETILFVHGLGSNKWAWLNNMVLPELYIKNSKLTQNSKTKTQKSRPTEGGGLRCIALDLPGYGQSSDGNFPYTMAFFADVVKRFIEKLGLQTVTLAGHSMGGQVALTLALSGYSKIKKLLLAAPAGIETFTTLEKIILKNVYSPFLIKMQSPEQVWLNFDMSFYKMPKEAAFMVQDRVAHARDFESFDKYADMIAKCVTNMLDEPVFDRLSGIKQPTHIVFGVNDLLIPNRLLHPTLTPLSIAQRGHKKIPNSQMSLLSHAGHFVQFEAALRFNELAYNFITI